MMKERIQMVDLQSQYKRIRDEVNVGIQEVIDSCAFIKGGKVVEFQNDLEKYLNVNHVIPVGNGTDALQIALMALGLQAGDEVITSTFTFIATVEVIALLGLTPVLVDVDFHNFNISIEGIKKAITPRTKAIIPVHLFGQNANMQAILDIAKEHNLYILEDACQSIGAVYTFPDGQKNNRAVWAILVALRFFRRKTLAALAMAVQFSRTTANWRQKCAP